MFQDFLRTATIILLLISGYLIIKKITELEARVSDLEAIALTKKEQYEEEYSTDHLFSMIKNNPTIPSHNYTVEVPQTKINVSPKKEEIIDDISISLKKEDITYTPKKEEFNLSDIKVSPTYTETIMMSDEDDIELLKKYNKMKLPELQKISGDFNIELKSNGKNKSKKILIKEIISHLNNNG